MKKLALALVLFVSFSITAQTDKVNDLLAENKLEKAFDLAKSEYEADPNNEKKLIQYLAVHSFKEEDFEEVLSLLIKLKEISKDYEYYYYKFWEEAFGIPLSGLSKNQLKELNWIIEESDFSGTSKAVAKYRISDHYNVINKHEEKFEWLGKIGTINDWSITGGFENISASGFDNDYAPLSQFKKSDKFNNKKGKEIYWVDAKKEAPGSWILLHHHLDVSNAICFAQTFVTSDKDQEVELRFGNTGNFKIWVNDGLVASLQEETNTYYDNYITKIKLKKGTNRILFQLGADEYSALTILARITDSNGNTIENLQTSPFANDYVKNQPGKENLGYLKYVGFFEKKHQENPNSIVYTKMLAEIYGSVDQKKELRDLLESEYKKFPNSSLINIELLDLYNELEFYSLYSGKLEEIKKKDPNGILTAISLYQDALETEKYDEAETYLNNLITSVGETPYTIKQQIDLQLKLENQGEAIRLIEYGYTKYPLSWDFVNLKYVVETKVNQSPSAGYKVLKKYLKKNYNSEALGTMAQYHFGNNNIQAGLEVMKTIRSNNPDLYAPLKNLAQVYESLRSYDKAIDLYSQLIEKAPFISSFYDSRGDCHKENMQPDMAIGDYKKAIYYSPTSFETRKKLRTLEGQSNIEDEFEEPDLYEFCKKEIKKEDYPEDNSVILLEEKQITLYEGGGREENNYMAVAVINNAGIDTWKEYYIPVSRSQELILDKAEVVKADGNITKAEANYNHIVYTGLEAGDKIILSYKLKSYYSGSLSEHFWDKQYLEYFIPLNKGVYSIMYHNSFDLEYKAEKSEIMPKIRVFDDYNILTWTVEDVPSIKDEDYMPRLTDAGAVLHLSTIPSWEYVIDWYDGLSRTKAKSDYEVKEIVKELFEGKESLSQYEKAKIIYDYIVNDIRYSSVSFRQSGWIPQKASSVINSKIGDCKDVSTLFVVMCKELGIDANLVLVNTKDNGRKKMTLPSIEFNHCIAKANLDGKEYFIELTSDLLPFSTVSGKLKEAFVLNIDPEKKEKPFALNSKNRVLNGRTRKTEITLDKTSANVKANNIKTGSYAANMRGTYRDLGKEARFKEMSSALSFDFSTIAINELKFDETLSDNSDSVSYFYDFTVNTPYTNIGDLKIFRVPMISKIDPIDFLSVKERKFDIEFWRYFDFDFNDEEITINIPKDKKLVDVPTDFTLDTGFASYKLTFKKESDKLIITRKFKLKTDLIKKEDYQAFRDFMNTIVEKENLNIGLRNK